MPQTGGAINRPRTPKPPKPPKPAPGRARYEAKVATEKKGARSPKPAGGSYSVNAGLSSAHRGHSVDHQLGGGQSAQQQETTQQQIRDQKDAYRAEVQRERRAARRAARREDRNRGDNARTFGIGGTTDFNGGQSKDLSGTGPRPTRTGDRTWDGPSGGGSGDGSRTFPVNDSDLVGSHNHIDNFGGTTDFFSSANEVSGGGGGTGDPFGGGTGEVVSAVGEIGNRSLEEVVYGVKKKSGKTKQRGVGE